MRRLAFAAVVLSLALVGCKNMEDTKLKEYVGDKDTKIYYKNVPGPRDKVPEANRVFFKSMDDAMSQGYKSAQEGNDAPSETQ